jgi:SAM-dependent methyltransferase
MTTAGDWSGKVGDVWADEWPRTERSFADLAPRLTRAILSIAPERGRFLDLGCGIGSTAAAIALARPGARVDGIDLSAPMIRVANARHARANLHFTAGDALTAALPIADLVFSRHGVMFFADPVAAFAHLRRRAAPGAPLVFSCFRARQENEWARVLQDAIGPVPAAAAGYAPGPFAFADRDFVADLLAAAGWRVERADAVDFSYVAGEGDSDAAAIDDALAFFARIGPAAPAIRATHGDERLTLRARIASRLARYATDRRVVMPAAAWIWTARAEREPA